MNIPYDTQGGILWQQQDESEIDVLDDIALRLIVWNDEVNTFDHVINSLIEVCEHTQEQAEQCSLFIHYKGKYPVKSGSFEYLEPRAVALIDRGIQATID